jgi:hypothetical protein
LVFATLDDKGFVKTGPDLSSEELANVKWPLDRDSRMHLVSPDCPPVKTLPRPGENLLVDKRTGKPCPAAPASSLLLTSAPFGWRGIIVERHRLPPAEMPEQSVIGHGISSWAAGIRALIGAHPGRYSQS